LLGFVLQINNISFTKLIQNSTWPPLQSKLKTRLVGASNFNAWKCRILNILEESELEELITRVIEEPTSNTAREAYRKKQAKAKRIIFYSVKDSMMPIIGHLRTCQRLF
jgi:hypothetical protein